MSERVYRALGEVSRARALRGVAWVAEYLGCSASWVYKAAQRGELPCIRIGAMLRFDTEAIRAFAHSRASGRQADVVAFRKDG